MALCILAFLCPRLRAAAQPDTLTQDFLQPPPTARPYVWWHWMGSNISQSGIDADLQAMAADGVAGATICSVGSTTGIDHTAIANSPWPNARYWSPPWWALVRHAVEKAQQLHLKIGMENCPGWASTGGPWITPELSMQMLVASKTAVAGPATFSAALPQPQVDPKFHFYRDVAVLAVPDGTPAANQVRDLTSQMHADGSLAWNVPPGKWTIFRLGHTTTGRPPHPMPEGVEGLEVDKLSAAAARFHLQHVLDALRQNLPASALAPGGAFNHILFDSYESGSQNWTEDFRQQFQARRGYDPLPYLPILFGRTIGSRDVTKRFQWDMERTISELFVDNDFAVYHQMLDDAHLQMCFEPYKGPFDTIPSTAQCNVPMAEFWTFTKKPVMRAVVAAAQSLGGNIVGAESFTGRPTDSQWDQSPATLKPFADNAAADGVNLFYLHDWTLQPFDDAVVPGLSCGWWGTHFGRNQTWADAQKPFFDYLACLSAVMQHGHVVADVATLDFAQPDADAISDAQLLQATAQGNLLQLPGGRQYRLLILPPDQHLMLPAIADKLHDLVDAGLTLLGPRPTGSPSLADDPSCDAHIAQIANQLWGNADPATPGSHSFGKGKVIWGVDAAQALSQLGAAADFTTTPPQPPTLRMLHRSDSDRHQDIYLLLNESDQSADFTATFHAASTAAPQRWNPVSHQREMLPDAKQQGGQTELPLHLAPHELSFIVFGAAAAELPTDQPKNAPLPAQPISGPWTLRFSPGRGAPDGDTTLPQLTSWSDSTTPGIRYFSGTATYTTTFTIASLPQPNQHLMLNLGDVRTTAHVTLNGHDLGILWCAPYQVDVAAAVQPGANTLQVAVSNNWRNRLIGDEQQPPDVQWGNIAIYNHKTPEGRPLVAFPDWLVKHESRPSPQRVTFTTWNYFNAKSKLEPSGLLGPVTLQPR